MATPDINSIPLKNGLPQKFMVVEGPTLDFMPLTAYGLGVEADEEQVRRTADKLRALATLADAELPDEFEEQFAEMATQAREGNTHMIAATIEACWN